MLAPFLVVFALLAGQARQSQLDCIYRTERSHGQTWLLHPSIEAPKKQSKRRSKDTPSYSWEDAAKTAQLAAEHYGLDTQLILAVIHVESGFNPRALSKAGALGLMQLMPATARAMGVGDREDPVQNIWGGTRFLYLLMRRFPEDLELALAAYFSGPGAVASANGIPTPASRRYVAAVLLARAKRPWERPAKRPGFTEVPSPRANRRREDSAAAQRQRSKG